MKQATKSLSLPKPIAAYFAADLLFGGLNDGRYTGIGARTATRRVAFKMHHDTAAEFVCFQM